MAQDYPPSLYSYVVAKLGLLPSDLEAPNITILKQVYKDDEIVKLYEDAILQRQQQISKDIENEISRILQQGLTQFDYEFIGDELLKPLVKDFGNHYQKNDISIVQLQRKIVAELNKTDKNIQLEKQQALYNKPKPKPKSELAIELKEKRENFLANSQKYQETNLKNFNTLEQINFQKAKQKNDLNLTKSLNYDFQKTDIGLSRSQYTDRQNSRLSSVLEKKREITSNIEKQLSDLQQRQNEEKFSQYPQQRSFSSLVEKSKPRFQKCKQIKIAKETGKFQEKQISEAEERENKRQMQYKKYMQEKQNQIAQKVNEIKIKQETVSQNNLRQIQQQQSEVAKRQLEYQQQMQQKRDNPDIERLRKLNLRKQMFEMHAQQKQEELQQLTQKRIQQLQQLEKSNKMDTRKFILIQEIKELNETMQGLQHGGDQYLSLLSLSRIKQQELDRLVNEGSGEAE